MSRFRIAIFLALLVVGAWSHKLEADADKEPDEEPELAEESKADQSAEKETHHVLDDNSDEFVGEPIERDRSDLSKSKDEALSTHDVLHDIQIVEAPQKWYRKYMYELVFVAVLVVYGLQFYHGKKYNEAMAYDWLTRNMGFLREQFACVGIEEAPEAGKPLAPAEAEARARNALIEQHSYSLFKYYATGRVNCNYCVVTLETKRRQDLLTMATFNLLWPELDRVAYEVPLSFSDSYPCVFAIMKRNEMKLILENNQILKDHTVQQKVEGLSQQYIVLSEYEEFVQHIMTPQLIEKLNSSPELYQFIEIKDDPASATNALTLRMDVIFPNRQTLERSVDFTRDVMRLVDQAASFRMGKGLREKVQERRAKTLVATQKEKREEKQEEQMKKKAEKQKERESKLATMTPEMQRKMEEKDRKRELKRQNKKLVKVVKKQ